MENEDYLLALRLQKEFDREEADDLTDFANNGIFKRKRSNDDCDENDLNSTKSLLHPEWETLDPTPDVKTLFNAFDNKFFQGRLKCVDLEWSKRMYSCAGICYTRRNRMGMAITIRLSEPLLKFRSRKDLIETLLHEMIHAYCGVLGIREGNGGHGPNFKKIMNGINIVAGTNITICHDFHDEVNIYKTHWWRCNGICQNRSPFFGFVKRTSNRAPGPNDFWWRQHLESCGGSFLKVKEPEKKKNVKKENVNLKKTIKTYFPAINKKGEISDSVSIRPSTSNKIFQQSRNTSFLDRSKVGGVSNLSNVVGFKNLSDDSGTMRTNIREYTMSGTGYSLTSSLSDSQSKRRKEDNNLVNMDKVRDIWTKKFTNKTTESQESQVTALLSDDNGLENDELGSASNENKVSINDNRNDHGQYTSHSTLINDHWTVLDDEIMVKEINNSVINISSSSSEEDSDSETKNITSVKKEPIIKSLQDRQREIKQEILETTDLDLTEDDIELIGDEFNDDNSSFSNSNNSEAFESITDSSLVDDLFSEDTLLKEFNIQNGVIASGTKYHRNSKNDIITCPICQEHLAREHLSEHLDGCVGITIKIQASVPGSSTSNTETKVSKKKIKSIELDSEKAGIPAENPSILNDEGIGRYRRRGLMTSTHTCPVCAQEVDVDRINQHLDICLK